MKMTIAGLAFGLAAFGLVSAAHAANEYEYVQQSQRKNVRTPPIKDCTRYNGYYGFYGNIWCTPAEQARWDKWSAERLQVR